MADVYKRQAEGRAADPDWQRKLSINSKGAIMPTAENVRLVLQNDPLLRGLTAYDLSLIHI